MGDLGEDVGDLDGGGSGAHADEVVGGAGTDEHVHADAVVRSLKPLSLPIRMAVMDRIMMTSMAMARQLMRERRGRWTRLPTTSLFMLYPVYGTGGQSPTRPKRHGIAESSAGFFADFFRLWWNCVFAGVLGDFGVQTWCFGWWIVVNLWCFVWLETPLEETTKNAPWFLRLFSAEGVKTRWFAFGALPTVSLVTIGGRERGSARFEFEGRGGGRYPRGR